MGAPSPNRFTRLRRSLTPFVLLNIAGIVVLVWWVLFWNHSVKKWQVRNSPTTWYGPYEFIAVDFLHNYQASQFWLEGGNPYTHDFQDPLGRKLCYPPIVLVTFAWCKLLPVAKAIGVWTIALGLLACVGAFAAWRSRRELKLAPVPMLAAVAMIATCSPVAFAMERGNYDLMIVPLVLLSAWALRRRGWWADGVLGYAIGLAICLKVYPGLMLVAILALRRWRAIGFVAAFAAMFLAFQWQNMPIFLANLRELSATNAAEQAKWDAIPPATHSLANSWAPLWSQSKLQFLTRIPGTIMLALLVGGLLLWVGWHVVRCANPDRVVLPLLLWIMTAATFVPSVSNDYNLVWLPLAMLAAWDKRDPVFVHVGLGFACLYLQPIAFHISTSVLFGFKLAALVLVAQCVVNRLQEHASVIEHDTEASILSHTIEASVPRFSIAVARSL
jgi:Glycosyltransferase family 87